MDPVALFERGTRRSIEVMAKVRADQLGLPTPCREWTVQDLMDHMFGGTEYLLSAIEARPPVAREPATVTDLAEGVAKVLDALQHDGVMTQTCVSPLGFDWPMSQAVAGTFMDNLVHTWDLATATGQSADLDEDLVDACVAMFLPDMPEHARAVGLVGPAVAVGASASPTERFLAAMGRRP